MPVTVVVGGQYGSEGKGKVTALLASQVDSPWLVRCGGPNSGHTVTIKGKDFVLRQVPSSAEPHKGRFCVAAGCVVDEKVLVQELDTLEVEPERIIVDPRAVILTDADRDTESRTLSSIGSTCSGTGAALVRRMSRRGDVTLAEHSAILRNRCRVETVARLLHLALDDGEEVIVEGTQGFALSLFHGVNYPFLTSRDTTAAGFAMEAGLSPRLVDYVVLVLRTFPIRVGGSSGPLENELSWEDIREISGAPEVFPEYTSVTKRLRRVARFDMQAIKLACDYNRPTSLAVMGMDRLDFANTGASSFEALTETARTFVDEVELATGVPVEIIGTGFSTFESIRRSARSHTTALSNA